MRHRRNGRKSADEEIGRNQVSSLARQLGLFTMYHMLYANFLKVLQNKVEKCTVSPACIENMYSSGSCLSFICLRQLYKPSSSCHARCISCMALLFIISDHFVLKAVWILRVTTLRMTPLHFHVRQGRWLRGFAGVPLTIGGGEEVS